MSAMNRLTPGFGTENTKDRRRVADAERFLGQFRKTRILAHDPSGKPKVFDVLASLPAPGKDTAPPPDAFAGIVEYTENGKKKTGIIGGTVSGAASGAKVVKNQELDLKAEGEWNEYLRIPVKAWTLDGHVLSGLETMGDPSWEKTKGDLPHPTIPNAPSGKGVAIVSIGRLVIKNHVATLYPQGRGEIVLTHFLGTLSHQPR